MSGHNHPAIVYVAYQGTRESRFDRDYYVRRHLPLVMDSWQAYGLESARAFFPVTNEQGTIAICECRFRDEAEAEAAFAASETPTVMADVKHFTDIEPVRLRGLPM